MHLPLSRILAPSVHAGFGFEVTSPKSRTGPRPDLGFRAGDSGPGRRCARGGAPDREVTQQGRVLWHRVEVWGEMARTMEQHARSGQLLLVSASADATATERRHDG